MRYFLYCSFSLFIALLLLVCTDQWIAMNQPQLLPAPESHVLLKNIKFNLNENYAWMGWLLAEEAQVKSDGLKLHQIQGHLIKTNYQIDIEAENAFWPAQEDKIYIPGLVKINDGHAQMLSEDMVIDLKEGLCYTDKSTTWQTEGLTMISESYSDKLKHIAQMFDGKKSHVGR